VTQLLTDTVAFVTGASSGIGAATAQALATQGAAVALVARRRDRLGQVAKAITDQGGSAVVLEADLTQTDQAADAVGRAADELGRLDIVVNNAGVLYPGPVAEAPAGEWEQMIAINLGGVLNVVRAALPISLPPQPGRRGTSLTLSTSARRVAVSRDPPRPSTASRNLVSMPSANRCARSYSRITSA
jgi:NADP-dependent 3-hydroxy acid dehydrogenase YdfG